MSTLLSGRGMSAKMAANMGFVRSIAVFTNSVVCLFVPSLSSCHEKPTVALDFGRIRNRLGVVHFQLFFDFLPQNLLLVRSH